jgi:hypothetical protein
MSNLGQSVLLGLSGFTAYIIWQWYRQPIYVTPIGNSWTFKIDWCTNPFNCSPVSKGPGDFPCPGAGMRDVSIPVSKQLCESKGWRYEANWSPRPACVAPSGQNYWACKNPDVLVPNK